MGDSLIVGVPRETFSGERRVALIPASLKALSKAGIKVLIEAGAGASAGFDDSAYREAGADITDSRESVFATADIIVQVRAPGANSDGGKADLALMREGQVSIGFTDPLSTAEQAKAVADKGVTSLSMEMIPRITRAQSMDALSSMATIAGYKAVLMAADTLPKMFPMLMTAAGTLKPARALVIGAGVAGLQAIATARRLGAVVHAYDVRPAVKEQIESLGAKFVELDLDTGDTEDAGGYAKQLTDAQLVKQREELAKVAALSHVIITTAAIPGRPSPLLITADAVKAMEAGSVIVDLASERGGNCELTDGERTVAHGVTILGPTNLPSRIPFHASQMYAKNITTLLAHLVKDGSIELDLEDAITAGTLVSTKGEVVHGRIRSLLGLGELPAPSDDDGAAETTESADAEPAKE